LETLYLLFELEFLILDGAEYIQIKLHLEQMAPAPLGRSARTSVIAALSVAASVFA